MKKLPWRVVPAVGCFQVWTAFDAAPGSRNNYVIADGIQSREEADLIAGAPEMNSALHKCKRAVENKELPPSSRLKMVRDYSTPALTRAQPVAPVDSYLCGCSYPVFAPYGEGQYYDFHCAACHRELWERAI